MVNCSLVTQYYATPLPVYTYRGQTAPAGSMRQIYHSDHNLLGCPAVVWSSSGCWTLPPQVQSSAKYIERSSWEEWEDYEVYTMSSGSIV